MSHLSNVKYSSGDWRNNNSDAVAVGIYDDLNLSRQLQGVNRELGRGISNALSANLIKGKIGEVQIVIGKKGTVAFVFGLGKQGELHSESLSIQVPTDRPAKQWMYLPAFFLLGCIIFLQRRRLPGKIE